MIVGVPGPKTAPLTAFHIEADAQILTALGDLLWRPEVAQSQRDRRLKHAPSVILKHVVWSGR
jgi:hypothetical protein